MEIIQIAQIAITSLFIIYLFIEIRNRVIQGNANEWILIIKNGKLIKAGIGLRIFRKLGQVVVRFPSLLNKVTFSAQQVTQEFSGVEVSGFIIWVINREDEGPFKAYKHIKNISGDITEDSEINQHLRSMAESLVRHQIANLEITDVIKQREIVRNSIREGIQEVVKGFGIWLETVEITDVKILSTSLFEDLQTPFRQSSLEKANSIRQESEKKMEEERIMNELILSKKRSDSENEKRIYEMKKTLEKDKEEEKLFIERQRIAKEKLTHEKELRLLEIQQEREINAEQILQNIELEFEKQKQLTETQKTQMMRVENKLLVASMEEKQELSFLQDKIKLESKLSPQNIQKLIIDAVQNLYKDLPVSDVKIVNMGANQGIENIIAQVANAVYEVQKQLDSSST